MTTVKCNGASHEQVAKMLGGVLILSNITDDEATIANVDPIRLRMTNFTVVTE